jgi:tricorn protease
MASGYYRFPAIHDENVIFVCEDDLWTVPASGGVARRLTSNLGEVTRPSLSPDGTLLAFVGREEGQPEVYVMPAEGGPGKRLTYQGSTLCLTCGWTPDGQIIYASNAEHYYLRYSNLYTIHPEGGPPQKLYFGLARSIAYGPGGGVVLGRHTDDPARWKRYRGGTAGQLWIDPEGNGTFQRLLPHLSNLAAPMWPAPQAGPSRIYFISDHEGVGNLYSCLPDGEDLRRHTHHEDYYVRNASSDGKRIVYHAGGDLYLFDPGREQVSPIGVTFHSPQVQRSRKFVSATRYLQDWALRPDGHALAITARGKMFTFANWEGSVFEFGSYENHPPAGQPETGVRFRLPAWLNDGKRLVALSDEGGEEAFVVWEAGNNQPVERMDSLDIGRPVELAVNPKKDQVAFSNHRYELFVLDLATRELRLVERGKANRMAGFSWSPDGEWLAYSVSTSQQIMALKLWKAATGEIFPLAKPVLRDINPAFDPSGKYLYFLSFRTFDPIYDNMQFDLGFPLGMKPYLVTLQSELLSPFIPQPKETQESGDKDEEKTDSKKENTDGEAGDTEEKGESQAEQKPPDFKIDLDGIENRVVAFPVTEGIYRRILGIGGGKVLYDWYPIQGVLSHPNDGEPSSDGRLMLYDFEEQKEESLVSGLADFGLSRNTKMLIYRAGNRLRVIKAGEKPGNNEHTNSRKSGWIDLERARVSVSPGAEWRQMFREAWRLQRDQFWTPDMSQVDWVGIHDRYLPLVDRVSSRAEFSDLMWEIQGELGTSHAYEFGGDYRPEPRYNLGFLGADYSFDPASGSWVITHIHCGDEWSNEFDSPLNKPGVNISTGDALLAINGRRLSQAVSPGMALVNLAGCEVTLTVLPAGDASDSETPSAPAPRQVTVQTLSSEMYARYRAWVEDNRRKVHAATHGRVGYVHIPDMMGWGYAEFHRGYLAEVERDGLIVDVRFNRGGHVSALLLEKLARRRIGYDLTRWSDELFPYPPESVLGPMVAVTNENAGSDGDIFSHGFKLMKLGKLIGMRTWGGVIGIWPRHSLVDGTMTTQPEFSSWFQDVGWNVENYGTDPDIEVNIAPQDYARGADPQLERAIHEIVSEMEANPPRLPELGAKPSLALPRLPQA